MLGKPRPSSAFEGDPVLTLTAAPRAPACAERTRAPPAARTAPGARVRRTPPCPQKSRAQSLVGNRPGAEHVRGEGLNLAPTGFLRLQI